MRRAHGLALAAAILLAVAFAPRPAPSPGAGAGFVSPATNLVSGSSLPTASPVPPLERLPALLRAGQIDAALALATSLPDPADRDHWRLAALRQAPPERLATHALAHAPGPARAALLDETLTRWTLLDPVAAGEWITRHLSDAAEFDRAAALLVQGTDTVHRSTATALDLAENLDDPELRLNALAHVIREWSEQDPDAALRYATSAPDFRIE